MNERDALLRAVLTDPADDTPRLVLADWLEENGEASRAALIRKQVARSNGQTVSWPLPRLRPRQWFDPWWKGRSCWSVHAPEWNVTIARVRSLFDLGPGESFRVSRGFVEQVCCGHDWLVANAADLFRRHPVRSVRFNDREPWEFGDGTWRIGSDSGDPDDNRTLHPEIFWAGVEGGVEFENRLDAVIATSRGAVALGRRLAGLPPLPLPAAA
ncbi:MAG TPA: TIGR02996 domain-containing protein [Gemmata sp.]|nr:TIGR02996 domain-containing protein [Gemmata sp.]